MTRGGGQVHEPGCTGSTALLVLAPSPQARSDAPQPMAGLALGVRHGSYRDATVNRHDVDDRVRKSRQQVAPRARVVDADRAKPRDLRRSTQPTQSARHGSRRRALALASLYQRTAASASVLAARWKRTRITV